MNRRQFFKKSAQAAALAVVAPDVAAEVLSAGPVAVEVQPVMTVFTGGGFARTYGIETTGLYGFVIPYEDLKDDLYDDVFGIRTRQG